MRVYLAGPMAGMPDHGFPAFRAAAEKLRSVGYEVTSPAEGVSPKLIEEAIEMGLDFRETSEYKALVKRGMRMTLAADTIVLLPGWEGSQGASLERDVAMAAGKRVTTVAALVEEAGSHVIRWVGPKDLKPRRTYAGDAGFDLLVAKHTTVGAGEFVDVSCGIRVELPPGVWAMIVGRSSTLRKRELLVSQGIIDGGWRGPLFSGVWNLGKEAQVLERGERVAQLLPFKQEAAGLTWERVEELSPSDRGEHGFGSTGV